MSVTARSRDRLTEVRDRTRKAREEVRKARDGIDAARKLDDRDAQVACEVRLAQAQDEAEMASELERVLLAQVAGVDGSGYSSESFLDDPTTIRSLEQLANSSMPIGNLALGPAMSREELVAKIQSGTLRGSTYGAAPTGDINVGDPSRLGPYYGVVPQLRRRLRLLDLIPTATMEGQAFDYAQEAGSFDTAVETPEATIKPPGDLQLNDATVEAKTIAHWVKLRRQQLADVAALGTIVQNRLTYGVMRRVENQIVAGDGVGENLLGILHTSGIGSVAFSAGEALSDLALDAITAVLVSDAEPNGVVMNPVDVATMLKAKASGSGERLDSEGAFASTNQTIWDLPRITSKVMPVGQALVGDFANGCTLFVREAVAIRVSDSDQDDFLKNKLTMLGEGRFGVAIWQPTAFALVHLA